MTRKTHVVYFDEKTGREIDAGRYEEIGPPSGYEHRPCPGCALCRPEAIQDLRAGDGMG